MSRSIGCVKLDGNLLWFAVNNSTDVGISLLYHNRALMESLWESNELGRARQCHHPRVPVQFYTGYAGGYYREGELCKECLTLLYSDETEYPPEDDFAKSEEYLKSSNKS